MPDSREACILALALLALALAGCVTEKTPELTLPVVSEEPASSPPPYPPPAPTITPLPTGGTSYPPPGQPTPYPPAPTRTPTATPWGIGNLPPLPTYPPPGPFQEMRILYLQRKEGWYVTSLDGNTKIKIDPPILNVSVSPNGKKMLDFHWENSFFPGQDVGDVLKIWTRDIDGSSERVLVRATQDWFPEYPFWSPDGAQIAYLRSHLEMPYSEGLHVDRQELWAMNSDGSNHHLLADAPEVSIDSFGGNVLFLKWMFNGYIYYVNSNEVLYALNPHTGDVYRLMDNVNPLAIRQSISPDGIHTAQFTDISKIQQSGMIPIAINGEMAGWSLDGRLYAYFDQDGLWVHELDSGEDRLVLPGASHFFIDFHGFSPDNNFIAYESDEGLYTLDIVSQGELPQLVVADSLDPITGDQAVYFVSWIPIP